MKKTVLMIAAMAAAISISAAKPGQIRIIPGETPIAKPMSLGHRVAKNPKAEMSVLGAHKGSPEKDLVQFGDPIYEVENAPKLYNRCVYGSYIESGFLSFHYGERDAAFISEDSEGNLYIKDIVSMSDFMSYTKLEPVSETRYKVTTPQRLYVDEYDGVKLYYDLMVMDKHVDIDDGTVYYAKSEETNEAYFNKTEDGKLVFETPFRFDEEQQDTQLPERVLGVQLTYTRNGETVSDWCGLAMYSSIFWECEEQPNAALVPTGMQTEEWALVYDGALARNGHFVPVGIDGDDLWIGNLYPGIDLWIKGKIEGDKVIFTGPQFMNTYYEFFEYFMPAKRVLTWLEDEQDYHHSFEYTDKLVLDFDRENKTLSITDPDDVILITWDLSIKGAADYWESPHLAKQGVAHGIPDRPVNYYYEEEYEPNLDSWTFFVSPVSTTDYLYKDDDLFLRLYCNGEQVTFTPEFYSRLTEDMTDVPYLYNDRWDFYTSGLMRVFAIYKEAFDPDIETLAVTLGYCDPETGEKVESAPLTYNYKTGEIDGVKKVEVDGEVKSVAYYDLNGIKIDKPTKGLYVKKVETTDGNVRTEKVIL